MSSGLDDTTCLGEVRGVNLWRACSPTGCLMSSLCIATMFPEKQHTSPAAEAEAAPQLTSFPVLGRALSLLTSQVLWASRNHSLGLGVCFAAEGMGRRPMTELATSQGQQPAPSTSPSGYELCPISSGLGPGEGNLLTVPLTG